MWKSSNCFVDIYGKFFEKIAAWKYIVMYYMLSYLAFLIHTYFHFKEYKILLQGLLLSQENLST